MQSPPLAGLALALQRALQLDAFRAPAIAASARRLAASCAQACAQARPLSTASPSPHAPSAAGNPAGPEAFVFDIDGVLIRGSQVLPEAKEALALVRPSGTRACGETRSSLPSAAPHSAATHTPVAPRMLDRQLHRGGRWRVPVAFLTNGGGVSEGDKAAELSRWLGVPVEEDQVGCRIRPTLHMPWCMFAPQTAMRHGTV